MRQRNLYLTIAAALFAAVLIAPAAQAQVAWDASIPFSFTVADTTLPAGDYLVQEVDQLDPSTFAITNADRDTEVLFKTAPSGEQREGNQPRLVFDVAGERAFLVGVTIPREELTRDVLTGDAYEDAKEKGMQMEEKVVALVVVD